MYAWRGWCWRWRGALGRWPGAADHMFSADAEAAELIVVLPGARPELFIGACLWPTPPSTTLLPAAVHRLQLGPAPFGHSLGAWWGSLQRVLIGQSAARFWPGHGGGLADHRAAQGPSYRPTDVEGITYRCGGDTRRQLGGGIGKLPVATKTSRLNHEQIQCSAGRWSLG
jgi:hypothetical protein